MKAPLGPRDNVNSPRGNSDADRQRRAVLEDAFAQGSRSDWGVALADGGDALLFGIGHRDFRHATATAGTIRQSAKPVRDTTFKAHAPDLSDGRWHDVVVSRARRTARAAWWRRTSRYRARSSRRWRRERRSSSSGR